MSNNERLARLKTTKERLKTEARDQGLCRPKVVIVVPFKESARRVVAIMRALLFGEGKKSAVANGKKFDDEFGKGDPEVRRYFLGFFRQMAAYAILDENPHFSSNGMKG